MTNAHSWVAPCYLSTGNFLTNSVWFPTQQIRILSTGTYIGDQATLDSIANAADAGGITLTQSPNAPAGYTGATATLAVPVVGVSGLQPWFAALAARNTRTVNVVQIGASITEGYNVGFSDSQEQLLAAMFRSRFPTRGLTYQQGGRGYVGVPTAVVLGTGLWPQVYTGGTFDDTTFGFGAKHRVWYGNTAGNKVVHTLAASITSFDIMHVSGTSGGASAGYYKIDGGTAVNFATNAGVTTPVRLHVAAAANSTIEIGCNGSGYVILDGIVEYSGDEAKGIQVHNCGHASYTAQNWNGQSVGAGQWPTSMALLNPDLIIIGDIGVNDFVASIGNRTPAQFQADLTSLIATLRGAGMTCPIVLSACYAVTYAGYTYVAPWSQYVAVMNAMAAADSSLIVVDHSARMPTTTASKTYSLYQGDAIHPTSTGQLEIASTLAATISPS